MKLSAWSRSNLQNQTVPSPKPLLENGNYSNGTIQSINEDLMFQNYRIFALIHHVCISFGCFSFTQEYLAYMTAIHIMIEGNRVVVGIYDNQHTCCSAVGVITLNKKNA